MDRNLAVFLSVFVMALVAIVALVILKERIKRIIIKLFGNSLDVQANPPERKGSDDPPSKALPNQGLSGDANLVLQPDSPPKSSPLPAWLSWRRLKISIPLTLLLVSMITPFWWWHRHSEAWKIVLSDHIAESWALWKQDPHIRVPEPRSGATLHRLTQLLDGYADVLARDPHRVIELWVVDHYWQYWATDTFDDYLRANRRFVDSGGKIHRMFILTGDDLKNPQLTVVLHNQCEKIGADVWRGDAAAIGNKAEYQITAKAFEQMPYTEAGFRSFDVLQLEDLTYYSSDFSPDYRVVGASTWFYGQKLDLKPLFNKALAQRIDCSSFQTEVVQNSQLQ